MNKRKCELHPEKKATWPSHDPHWCTKTCAANAAYGYTLQVWCEKHKDWYHEHDGCWPCEQEKRDEE